MPANTLAIHSQTDQVFTPITPCSYFLRYPHARPAGKVFGLDTHTVETSLQLVAAYQTIGNIGYLACFSRDFQGQTHYKMWRRSLLR